jgi:hypothetical protein
MIRLLGSLSAPCILNPIGGGLPMKRKALAVSLSVVAGLACVWLASPTAGALTATRVAVPDLVVTEIRLVKLDLNTEFPAMEVAVRVKNIGLAQSLACPLFLEWSWNMPDLKCRTTGALQLPSLSPGNTAERRFTLSGIGKVLPLKGMFTAAVDPAVAGKPVGQVFEGSELNNVFGFTCEVTSVPTPTAPIIWKSPSPGSLEFVSETQPTPPGSAVQVRHPDLVVTEVRLIGFSRRSGVDEADLELVIKNIGTADCSSFFEPVVRYASNLLDPQSFRTLPIGFATPLAPGATRRVYCPLDHANVVLGQPWKGMLIVAVDPATAVDPAFGHPSGWVPEYSGELNNVFGFTFNTGSTSPSAARPIVWKNPAVKSAPMAARSGLQPLTGSPR